MIRTFVAIPLPRAWLEHVSAVSAALAARTRGISWVRPENFHFTIRFLGDLGESGVARVGDAVARGAEGRRAPRASLGPLGAFPSWARPRALWLGLATGDDALREVGKAVNDAIDRAGFDRADKPFRPHLTLGRVREGATGLESLRAEPLPPPPPPVALDRIVVMKSDLHPSGARYTAIREVRLPSPQGDDDPGSGA
jgi:2'-5' RNA ligase